jgi:hypothetical protein
MLAGALGPVPEGCEQDKSTYQAHGAFGSSRSPLRSLKLGRYHRPCEIAEKWLVGVGNQGAPRSGGSATAILPFPASCGKGRFSRMTGSLAWQANEGSGMGLMLRSRPVQRIYQGSVRRENFKVFEHRMVLRNRQRPRAYLGVDLMFKNLEHFRLK